VFKVWNTMSSAGDSVDLEELEDYSDFMQKLNDMGMNWVILAYVAMVGARMTCPEARGAGDDLSLKNPLHGLLFWFMVLEFLCYSAREYKIQVPGLSLVDGDEATQKLSSHASVEALAMAKIAALTTYCVQEGIKVPDYSAHFFKTEIGDAGPNDLENELAQESADGGSEPEEPDEEEDEEEEDPSNETAGPQRKKPRNDPKAPARTGGR